MTPLRELSLGLEMVPLQEGTVLVLTDAGVPEDAPTRVGAGYWVSLTGYERLQASLSQVQADKAAAEARANALQQSLSMRAQPVARVSTVTVVAVAVAAVLVLTGGVNWLPARAALNYPESGWFPAPPLLLEAGLSHVHGRVGGALCGQAGAAA